MDDEIELVSDGDGVVVLGDSGVVERFLSTAGVPSRDLGRSFGTAMSAGSAAAKVGSEIAANSGRWVKLTSESAKAMKVSDLMTGSSSTVSRAITVTKNGKITGILEIVKPGSVGSMLTNPAILAGAAGIMAQLAMQQTMEEITAYLAVIDEKVDDILRAQKDAVLAEMIGVGLVIDEAMIVREYTGRVSEITWSKVQGAAQTIATVQGYALSRLDAIAEKMETKSKVSDLAKVARDAEEAVGEWLGVLARCFQLQDGLAVLELDRVLDADPEELNAHRTGLRAARDKRRSQIGDSTARMLTRMDVAAESANEQVLLHPFDSAAVIRSRNRATESLSQFNQRLGIEDERPALEAKRWTAAATATGEKVVAAGSTGAQAATRFTVRTAQGAAAAASKAADEATRRLRRRKSSGAGEPDAPGSGELES